MGSRSSSATTQTSNVRNDNISGIEEGAVVLSDVDGLTLETTDFGTVSEAFEFAGQVVQGQQQQLDNTLKSINAANATSADLDGQITAQNIKNVSMYGALALVAISVIYIAMRRK